MAQKLIDISLATLVGLLLAGCSSRDQQLKDGWWKYSHGYHVGDVIDFNEVFSTSGDTVYRDGQKVGVIVRRTKGWIGDNNEITISSMDGKQSGIYYQKK